MYSINIYIYISGAGGGAISQSLAYGLSHAPWTFTIRLSAPNTIIFGELIDMFCTTKFVTFTRHWGVRKFRRMFRRPTGFARSPRKFHPPNALGELSCLAVVQHKKMDVVSAGLNDAHSGRLLGFYLMTYGEGTLDKE